MSIKNAFLFISLLSAVLLFTSNCSEPEPGVGEEEIYPDAQDILDVPSEEEPEPQEIPDVEEVELEETPGDNIIEPDEATPLDEEITDEGITTDVIDAEALADAPEDAEVFEEEFVEPECPCDETIIAKVCGIDNKTYNNDVCAKCAICSNCPGCQGTKDNCDFLDPLGETNPDGAYLKAKAACEECICTPQEQEPQMLCGCLNPDSENPTGCATYTSLCHMKCSDAYKGNPNWEDHIVYLGKCKDVCAACEEEIFDPICGIDNLTYNNKCSLYNCPKSDMAKQCVKNNENCVKCGGECIDASKCPHCLASPCDMVCGLDGNTYPNVCTASCIGVKVDYPYPCCKGCPDIWTPVCGEDFHTYKNQCFLDCLGIGKLYDGDCTCNCDMEGPEVCGKDGKTHPNECWANCLAGGILYEGPCKTLCPQCKKDFVPVCGKIGTAAPKTFQNECFLTCQQGTKLSDGACQTCIDICGTPQTPKEPIDGPVCGEEGVTYPTSCFPIKCTLVNFTQGAC